MRELNYITYNIAQWSTVVVEVLLHNTLRTVQTENVT